MPVSLLVLSFLMLLLAFLTSSVTLDKFLSLCEPQLPVGWMGRITSLPSFAMKVNGYTSALFLCALTASTSLFCSAPFSSLRWIS